MRFFDRLVEVARRERELIVFSSLFALALALVEQQGPGWAYDWHFLISLGVCLAGGVLLGRWWALAVPPVVENVVGLLDGGAPMIADPYLVFAAAAGVGLRKAGSGLVAGRGRVPLDRGVAVGLALYLASAVGFMTLVLVGSFEGPILPAFVVLAVVHVLAGFAIGRWYALFLPALLVVLALPVPTDPDAYEPIPLWLVMAFWGAPIGAFLLAVGVGARRLRAHLTKGD